MPTPKREPGKDKLFKGKLRYSHIDVFADTPLAGNAALVVLGKNSLDNAVMQAIAREANLSETIFILPPTNPSATWRAKTFTTLREIEFAGHPTIAAADAVARCLNPDEHIQEFVQECDAGLIKIKMTLEAGSRRYCVKLPNPRFISLSWTQEYCAELLGISAASIINQSPIAVATGVLWALIELSSHTALRDIDPDFKAISAATRAQNISGIVAFYQNKAGLVRLRTFAPKEKIYEDAVCGSCMGSIMALFYQTGRVSPPVFG